MHEDGSVEYVGSAWVKEKGFRAWKIGPEKVAELAAAFKEARLDSLADSYPPDATDNPTAITSFRGGKRIVHDLSSKTAPLSLRELEDRVDQIAGSQSWIGPEGERCR